MKKKPSINRWRARDAEKKFMPAIKILSEYMHKVNPKTPDKDFFGYELSAGEFIDNYGVKTQLQIRAVRTKSQFIKDEGIKPIIRKWAILFKSRLFFSVLIDKIFND